MTFADLWMVLDRAGFETMRALFSVLWQSSILLGAAGLLALAMRRRSAAARQTIWAVAIVLTPLLPILAHLATSAAVPQAPIPVMPEYTAPLPSMPAVEWPPPPMAPVRAWFPLDYPWAMALLAYAAGATALMTLVLVGRFRIGRWLRRGRVVTDAGVLAVFESARTLLALKREFTVVESAAVRAPLTIGTLHPAVLLPTGFAAGLSQAELQAVAIHELSHVARRDAPLLAILSCVRAALWFHPLVWLACRQVATLAEQACDDRVLEATGEPVSYARLLARLAEELPRRALGMELAAGVVFSKGALLKRVEAILSHRRDQIRRLSRAAFAATVLGAIVSVAVALALPLADKPPPAEAEKAAAPAVAAAKGEEPVAAPPPAAPKGEENPKWREVLIPDADTNTKGVPVILELASGKMLVPPDGQGNWPSSYFTPLGQGDVGFDRLIVILRGGRLTSPDGRALAPKETMADASAYELATLPEEVVVKTADGAAFRLRVVTGTPEGGLRIRYTPAAAPPDAGQPSAVLTKELAERMEWVSSAEKTASDFVGHLRNKKIDDAYKLITEDYRQNHKGLAIAADRLDFSKAMPSRVGVAVEAAFVILGPVPSPQGDVAMGLGMLRFGGDWLIRDVDWLPTAEDAKKFENGFTQAYPNSMVATVGVAAKVEAARQVAEQVKAWVEDYFRHNYRDITARQTLEWGEVQKEQNGNLSIRYKYLATIWDKDKFVIEEQYTFGPDGKFVSVKSLSKVPAVAPAPANRPAGLPENASAQLIGTWRELLNPRDLIFRPDRTFELLQMDRPKPGLLLAGTWELDGRLLTRKITQSPENAARAGQEERQEIWVLSPGFLELRTPGGPGPLWQYERLPVNDKAIAPAN